ncbi:serine hydrolase [Flavobacterium sp. NKUCC04_CG]|uniref:serine hydrolase n=1 Tax=Flavobacterium sp. NKUCC04_CG TaxID=2842121 RepID=UPI001C5A882D|nr:serine hydrolase [Flavobacterium sp. NKUCC04_CG]MBW3517995.1 serine hydrolase [Flavobacterium sp. NKUCC04_CG]
MKKTLFLIVSFISLQAWCQVPELHQQIDEVTRKAMAAFDVPGIAVAVVKDGQIIHSQGYGLRSIASKEAVDENTMFGIASNSKAFTAAALAILVDQKKLDWDDKVIQYIPEFKMYNKYVTDEFTIRDLLTHRSGLGLGAGDLMIWPDGHDFTPQDIVANIQHLKPVSGFRSQYDYDNLLYIIAGIVIERISHQSWAEFVEQNIMNPIGMTASAGNWNRLKNKTNAIVPHVPINGKLTVVPRYTNTIMDAAGGIYSNINELSKWVQVQLNEGQIGDRTLFSKTVQHEMWTPQTWIPNRTTAPYYSLFNAYGLGWQLTDVAGTLQVSHTGGLEGIVTQITLLPQQKLGIIVLTNQQSGAAFQSITNTIKNYYLKLPYQDFVVEYQNRVQQNNIEAKEIVNKIWTTVENNKKAATSVIALNQLIGNYKDAWFGEVSIYKKKSKWVFESKRSPELSGEIHFYQDQTFVVKWYNESLDADAFIKWNVKDGRIEFFEMEPISPLTDFSYDFQDLHFTPSI